MEEVMISIPLDEYRYLLGRNARIEAFGDFVKKQKYAIERDTCGALLGFKTQDIEVIDGCDKNVAAG